MSTTSSEYHLRAALPSDADFLGAGILESERDIHGTGIWDVYVETAVNAENHRDEVGRRALAHVVMNSDPDCVYNHSRLIVAAFSETNEPVACATGFLYPRSTLVNTINALKNAMMEMYNWTEEDCEAAARRLDFIDQSYPNDVEFDQKWMVEGVFTSENHRRKGLARMVVEGSINRARTITNEELAPFVKPSRCLISCSVGNSFALTLYEKIGFARIGSQPYCQECYDKIGTSGFFYLELEL